MARAASLHLLSLSLFLSLSSSTVSALKCCPPGQVLTTNLTCGLGNKHYLLYDAYLGLNCSGNLSTVRPSQDVRVHCLDVVVEEAGKTELTGVRCEAETTHGAFLVPEVHYVRKCCPMHRKYTDYRHGCWSEEVSDDPSTVDTLRSLFLNDTRAPVSLEVGVPRCGKGAVLRDIVLHHRHVWRQESESIVLKHQGTSDVLLVPEEFCVDLVTTDDYSLVVRACHDATVLCDLHHEPCINKCCGDGQSYQGFACADTKSDFDVQFFKLRHPKPPEPVTVTSVGIAFEDQSSFKCTNGKYLLNPRASPDDVFYVSADGSLLIPKQSVDLGVVGWRDFCLEEFQQRVVPFLCFPQTLDGLQEKNHFRLIAYGLVLSGGFLLVTLIVYTCLPALHNLHGLTLMCYVAALLLAYTCLVLSQLLSAVIPPPLCIAISEYLTYLYLHLLNQQVEAQYRTLMRIQTSCLREVLPLNTSKFREFGIIILLVL